jgi:hypothetical protein
MAIAGEDESATRFPAAHDRLDMGEETAKAPPVLFAK